MTDEWDASQFPFSLPVVHTLRELDLNRAVTFFVGENGSGKSTLLEAIAIATELPTLGADPASLDITLSSQRTLAAYLCLSWTRRSRRGFFLRAEDVFGYLKRLARDDARMARELRERPGSIREQEAPELGAVHPDERSAASFLRKYDSRSHGESFMELFATRFRTKGLYLLDEPEAPLSPQRQLALLAVIDNAAAVGAQFIIATHSPILVAYPNARIYSFDQTPITEVKYEDLEHVSLLRAVLNEPARFVRQLRAGRPPE